MSDRINDFLDKICASVKYRTMHSEIREEFKNHIDEAVFEFEKFSRGHEAAVNMSLSKLGNATETVSIVCRLTTNSVLQYGRVL